VRVARRRVLGTGKVVLSLYVNPTQFAPHEDLTKYPRDLERDLSLCREAGVDVVFAPHDAEMYPGSGEAKHSTYVVEESLSQGMEGASRPTHFRGVTTVVAKLFNLVLPEVAVFGAKDYQQAAVVRRMVRDLNFPLSIVVAPTVREPDGLALSSRNKYLDPMERRRAVILWQLIEEARWRVRTSRGGVPAKRIEAQLRQRLAQGSDQTIDNSSRRPNRRGEIRPAYGSGGEGERPPGPAVRLDYLAFFDPETLRPVTRVKRGTQMALAVVIGRTRLIDNARLE
jgi:pantoate--beta-alanine ligase